MKISVKLLLIAFIANCVQNAVCQQRQHTLIDDGWRFALADDNTASQPRFNDSKWRVLDLPHDWSVEGVPQADNPSGNDGGYYPTGVGWYRRHFSISDTDLKRWLYFEGVYERSDVYVNGVRVGGHPYGYSSFFCDISDAVKKGDNVVAVRVDNAQQKNCRWYSGSGIYRHVWMVSCNKIHIGNWGVRVTTPDSHTVEVHTAVVNDSESECMVSLTTSVEGKKGSQTATLKSGEQKTMKQVIKMDNPKLWTLETPYRYVANVTLFSNNQVVDEQKQEFGIRTIEYSAESGFKLNGKPLLINGGCAHHDNGLLGAAAFDKAEIRKVELMKMAGFNAVRTSHNPPSEAFLYACDSLGLLVIDEAFDGWRDKKNDYDYSSFFDKWWQNDIEALVRRDRNHPSIFCWSIGNEVIERKKIEVVTTARKLASEVRKWDDSRPVTSALAAWDNDWEIYDPLAEAHDIVGYNYMIHKAKDDHKRVPHRVMMQTESYPRDAFNNWAAANDNKYVIGDFVWTAIDYLGESGIGRWWYEGDVGGEHWERPLFPWHAAYCGDIDLTGWRKPISHYRDMLWNGNEKLYMAVREPDGYYGKVKMGAWAVWPTWESWNWPGYEGKNIDVEIYSRCQTVRLYLNGNLVGEKPTSRNEEFKAVFTLPYQQGELRTEGIDNGLVIATQILKTPGKTAKILAKADKLTMSADGQDLIFVTIEMTDCDGIQNSADDSKLNFEVKGAALIQAVGNADIKDINPTHNTNTCNAWKGRAMVVLRSTHKKGNATLIVSSPGLENATLNIKCR